MPHQTERKSENIVVAAPAPKYVGPPNHHGGRGNQPIHRIVMHSLVSGAGPGTAKHFAAYFRSTPRMASCHYIVDPGTVLQLTYDSTEAFHAPPNQHSLGVEMADNPGPSESRPYPARRWLSGSHAQTLARAAKLVAGLCLAYDVPIRKLSSSDLRAGKHGICAHVDVSYAWHQTSHWDCGEFPWAKFIRMVKQEAKALQGKGSGIKVPTGGGTVDPTKTHNSGPDHRLGDVGTGVRGIQKAVGAEVDGVYGNETKKLVAAWQKKHGLLDDGIWGPATRAAYTGKKQPEKKKHHKKHPSNSTGRVLKVGSHGKDVKNLQSVLNAWYPRKKRLVEDGSYGRKTKARVRYMQKRAGLLKDGVAGPVTLGKLGIK